jgi:hypothetical protein
MRERIFGLPVFFAILFVISGCGGSGGSDIAAPGVNTQLDETFSSYNASNYTVFGGGIWSTASATVVPGNIAIQNTSAIGYLIYNNYTSTDYTVSARIKPSAVANACVGVVARFYNDGVHDNFYSLTIEGTAPSQLVLRKFYAGTGNSPGGGQANFVNALSTSTWYTITLKVSGTLITGTVTDGVTTSNISYNDNVNFNGGPALASGKAGLFDESSTLNSFFDDLIITQP